MAASGSSEELIRSKDDGSVEGIDRLSDLPDGILGHILSFLDTKAMVKTSVLSRRWKYLWRDVPVLNFQRGSFSFSSQQSFKEHVIGLLSLQSRQAIVRKINFRSCWPLGLDPEKLDRVLQYVASYGTSGDLHYLSFKYGLFDFSPFLASIIANHHHESLRTLSLDGFRLVSPLASRFKKLKALQLHNCSIDKLESFADFPCLISLKLLLCHLYSPKLSDLQQLLDLELQWSGTPTYRTEICAPKLKSLRFANCIELPYQQLPKLHFPVLEHANIRIRWWDQLQFPNDRSMEAANRASIELLLDLHNVESLVLCFDRYEHCIVEGIPIAAMNSLMESGPSPFTRLKTLKFQYRGRTPFVPYQVIRYFLDGSPDSKDKSFALEKICD